jgi:NOL1/NOP2/fmu family ribosome biogenesis protein
MRDSSHLEKARHLKVSAVGLKAFEKVGAFVKPTTRFIQLFGNRATKGKLEISEEQLETLKDGGALSVDTRAENGYLILSTHGNVIGLGLLIDGELRSQLPRR